METDEIVADLPETLKMLREISLSCIFKDISPGEYAMLKIMLKLRQKSKSGCVYVSDVVKSLHATTPAVSKTLKSLEQKGLVKRETDKENRRKTLVQVTEKGCEVKAESDKAFQLFLNGVYKNVGKDDMDKFNSLAKKIAAGILEELKLIHGGK